MSLKVETIIYLCQQIYLKSKVNFVIHQNWELKVTKHTLANPNQLLLEIVNKCKFSFELS